MNVTDHSISIGKDKKYVPNLNDNKKYFRHYRILQSYLQLGMKLTRILRMLKLKNLSA